MLFTAIFLNNVQLCKYADVQMNESEVQHLHICIFAH